MCGQHIAGPDIYFQLNTLDEKLPDDWKSANITPNFKKGPNDLAENYCTVSLSSVISKTMEHIIYSHFGASGFLDVLAPKYKTIYIYLSTSQTIWSRIIFSLRVKMVSGVTTLARPSM